MTYYTVVYIAHLDIRKKSIVPNLNYIKSLKKKIIRQ